MKFIRNWSYATWGMLFGLGTLLLNSLAHDYPEIVEQWYSRGLFQLVRTCLDNTITRLPFPTFYLFWAGVLFFWIRAIYLRPTLNGLWEKSKFWWAKLLGFAGLLVGLFFWMWGFNYARVPFQTQLKLQVQPLDSTALWQEFDIETKALDSLRTALVGNDTNALNELRFWPVQAEDTVRQAVTDWLSGAGFPVNGRVRGRFIHPEGLLFKFGASGIYWPFIGEGNLEAGLHPLRKLPSMAHEMSHGYGFSDEGICNFIAFEACVTQPNPYLSYCAHLDYWSTVAHACWVNNRLIFERLLRNKIPPGILADEDAIRLQHQKFKELAPSIRYKVYDSYLKAQGIKTGMLNYDEVLMLVHAWRKKEIK